MYPKIALIPLLALAATLAACAKSERSAIALEVTGDLAAGTATISCTASTSGTCHILFRAGDTTKAASAAVGATTTVDGLIAGMGFCSDVTAPDPATCKPVVLVNGRQVVRHERTVRE